MALFVGRLILLVLLACDWAADPSQGTSPLSRPLASTETYCHSVAYRAAAVMQCAPHAPLHPACLLPCDTVSPPPPSPAPGRVDPPPLDGLVYVILSIRR